MSACGGDDGSKHQIKEPLMEKITHEGEHSVMFDRVPCLPRTLKMKGQEILRMNSLQWIRKTSGDKSKGCLTGEFFMMIKARIKIWSLSCSVLWGAIVLAHDGAHGAIFEIRQAILNNQYENVSKAPNDLVHRCRESFIEGLKIIEIPALEGQAKDSSIVYMVAGGGRIGLSILYVKKSKGKSFVGYYSSDERIKRSIALKEYDAAMLMTSEINSSSYAYSGNLLRGMDGDCVVLALRREEGYRVLILPPGAGSRPSHANEFNLIRDWINSRIDN